MLIVYSAFLEGIIALNLSSLILKLNVSSLKISFVFFKKFIVKIMGFLCAAHTGEFLFFSSVSFPFPDSSF
ncbi:MAG: hypothetical protein ACI910_000005 [Oleispira sp.]|jgi:hypothetical protein